MTSWHAQFSSRSLLPFTRGESTHYVSHDGVTVTAVRPRPGVTLGQPIKGGNVHLIGALAGAWTEHGLILGARWLCGATSIGCRVMTPEGYAAFFDQFYEELHDHDADVCYKCRAMRDGEIGPCVYRVYDKTGNRLLYIGSTGNWPSRRDSHRNQTWWWQLAKHVDCQYFDTLAEASAAEEAAIRTERPQMNVVHNRREALS